MQLLTPRVVATAVRIEMTRLKMSFHFSLLIIICVFKINTVSLWKDWWDSHLQSYNIRKWKCEVGRGAVKKSEIM